MKLRGNKRVRLQVNEFEHVALTLVGCGGTGSHVASGLVALGMALEEKGIGLDMLFIDPDVVEEKNVGRQLFGLADVGRPKAVVLAERLNNAFAATIGAAARSVDALDKFRVGGAINIVIGAVDNTEARRMIERQVVRSIGKDLWWLDIGNDSWSGQVGLGCASAKQLHKCVDKMMLVDRLPAPSVVWPDLVKKGATKVATTKRGASCAELMTDGEQGLMVNRMAAAWACSLLYDFLVWRDVRWFALAFDLAWGGTRAYTLDVETLAEVTGCDSKYLVR